MARVILMALFGVACEVGEGGFGEGGEGGEGGSGQGDGGGLSGTCSTANETCGPGNCGGEGSSMLPGANCLACHTGGEGGRFTVGGTVFTDIDGTGHQSGVVVTIHDASGKMVTLNSNSAGNFYSTQDLNFPITAEVEKDGFTTAMSTSVSTGACNDCHQCDGAAGGKLNAN